MQKCFNTQAQMSHKHINTEFQHLFACIRRTIQPQKQGSSSHQLITQWASLLQEWKLQPKHQHFHKTIIPQMWPSSRSASNAMLLYSVLTPQALGSLNHQFCYHHAQVNNQIPSLCCWLFWFICFSVYSFSESLQLVTGGKKNL